MAGPPPGWLFVLLPELRARIYPVLDTLSLGALARTCRRMALETYAERLPRARIPRTVVDFTSAWHAGIRHRGFLLTRCFGGATRGRRVAQVCREVANVNIYCDHYDDDDATDAGARTVWLLDALCALRGHDHHL